MGEKKNSCPVCFTKMRTQNNVLVCPECGYKLCDHSYTYHQSYSTEHTHTPNYTTSYKANNFAPTGNSTPAGSAPQPTAASLTGTRAGSGSGKSVKLNRGGKIAIILIVIMYFIVPFLSILGTVFASLIKAILNP